MKIIAEVGSNWKSLDDCFDSILCAKNAGADAVKFQLFNPSEMFGGSYECLDGSTPHLDPSWIVGLSSLAKDHDIEFMCTGFSPSGYEIINEYVQTHKIASAEITDRDILRTVNEYRKPVYLSTGGASLDDIETAIGFLEDCPVTILFCVTDYPARIVDFRHLDNLRKAFGGKYLYGYSDHSTDVLNIPYMAWKRGCSVIEKHVNFTSYTDTDDAPHSLNAKEFRLMVKSIRGDEIHPSETFIPCTWQRKLIGDGYYRPLPGSEL